MTNQKILYNSESGKDPSDLIRIFHSIDNFKKLFILYSEYEGGWTSRPPSSSGSGHLSFKEAAGIRIPLGVGYYEKKFLMDYQFQFDSSWVDARVVNGDGL
nr:hypothetical_protein [Ipomoea batatas]